MSDRTELKTAYAKALDILARRDHTTREIRNKLMLRGFDSNTIDFVQSQLVANNLIDDRHFAESFVRIRSSKGFGERDIRAKLHSKGVSAADVDSVFATIDIDWLRLARQALQKKLNKGALTDQSGIGAKRAARFLESRGFTTRQIYRVIDEFSNEQGEVY